jgi:hypothetical protein
VGDNVKIKQIHGQSTITNFFQKLPLEYQTIHRPISHSILRQTHITDYFGREAQEQRRLRAKNAYLLHYNSTIKRFRVEYYREHPNDVFLGSRGGFCYYRTEFSHYFVIEPATRQKVGELELDDDYFLQHLWVSEPHRRRGIGTNMVRFANHVKPITVCIDTSYNSRYRLTNEGVALIRACQAKGILQDEQLFDEPMQSPDYGF